MISLWLFLLIFLTAVLVYKLEQLKFKGVLKIPGPIDLPLLGNILSFGVDIKGTFHNAAKLHDIYGPIVRIWTIIWTPNVMLNDADYIGAILSSVHHIEKSRNYKYLEAWIGNGLLTSTGDKWHTRRKLITPAFHFKNLQQYIKIFSEEIDGFIEEFRKIDDQIVDIHSVFNLFTIDIIAKTLTGNKLNSQFKSSFISLGNKVLMLNHHRLFSLWKNSFTLYPYSLDYIKLQKCVKKLQNFTGTLIDKRINQGEQETTAKTLIDFLLKAKKDGKISSDEGIKEEIDTFMFEGQDTLASVLAFTFYEISKQPKVQEKIFEEINSKISGFDWKSIDYSILSEFEYIGAVIKEGLRLYPPVPILMRKLNQNAQLGKYTVDKGVEVILNIYSLHRQEKYFPNPNFFDPERFLGNVKDWHPFCYIPFSGGPRNCIGQKFAVLLMKMVVIRFFSEFKLLPASPEYDLQITNVGILRSLNGVNVKLEKRVKS